MTLSPTPRILIIAGSDSGGGAGIQADIKTVTMLGGHAMTAITAITAQNTLGVQAVHPVPTDMVVAQMRSCLDDIGVDAIKIGMIGSAETAHAVADELQRLQQTLRHPGLVPGSSPPPANSLLVEPWTPEQVRGDEGSVPALRLPVVFDPVMVATSGAILADADTIAAFDRLLALATVATPNTPELVALSGCEVTDEVSQQIAVDALMQRTGCRAVLAKGGHLIWGGYTYGAREGGEPCRYDNATRVFDVLFADNVAETIWDYPRIETPHTHGTGCTLASAIATGLGSGMILSDATGHAIRFVRTSLEHAPGLGHGNGPMGQQFATGFRCPA